MLAEVSSTRVSGREKIKKVVLYGPSNAGKTALAARLHSNTFEENSEGTIGANYRQLEIGNQKISLWDTAGQERYNSMSSLYFRDADIVIVCGVWGESVELPECVPEDAQIIRVFTKSDLKKPDYVPTGFVRRKTSSSLCVEDIKVEQLVTSAKTGEGVGELKLKLKGEVLGCKASLEISDSKKDGCC